MDTLLDKIKKIESLISRSGSEGEKQAAISAKERLLKKYPKLDNTKNLIE